MTSQFEAVLFDLDGTLLDTADDLGASLNYVLEHYKYPNVDKKAYTPVASDGSRGLLELGFQSNLDKFDYPTLQKMLLDHYQANICIKTTLFDGMGELLQTLIENNIVWGVVTNKPEFLTTPLLAQFELFKRSAIDISGDTLAKRKPHPEPLLHAAKQIAVAPEKCLYVGDALRDIQAGNDAMMTTAVAGWGYIKASDDTDSWQADHYCDHIQALSDLIFK